MEGGGGGGNGDLPPDLPLHRWILCALDLARLPPVGSKVLYFPQGHFEQWAEHLDAPPDGHGPSIPCIVTSLDVFTAAHAPYAVVSLTPAPHDGQLGAAPAPAVLARPAPTTFVYNFKRFVDNDSKPSLNIPKPIYLEVLPKHGDRLNKRQLVMVDTKGRRWSFSHERSGDAKTHYLRAGWKDFHMAKNAEEHDNVFFLRGADGRLFIELRKATTSDQAAAQRIAAPPPDLGEEIAQAANLSAQGTEFTATYYPHKRLGKFFVPQLEVEEAMGIQWAAGMEVRLRQDVVQHTKEPCYSTQQVIGIVKAVTNSIWHGLEIEWDDSTTSMASAWEVDLVGDLPNKKRKVDVAGPSDPVIVFGTNLAVPRP